MLVEWKLSLKGSRSLYSNSIVKKEKKKKSKCEVNTGGEYYNDVNISIHELRYNVGLLPICVILMKPYKQPEQHAECFDFLHPCLQSPSVFIKHVKKTLISLPICDCVLKDRTQAPPCLHASACNIKVGIPIAG